MAHSYSANHVHAIFSAKDRRKTITHDVQPRLWAHTTGIGKNHGIILDAICGTENHVHVLFRLPPSLALAKAVLILKANSSRWMRERDRKFSWQEGYGAFSVSSSNLDAVVRYIRNQQARHQKISFEAKYRAILQKHGLEYDARFVFG